MSCSTARRPIDACRTHGGNEPNRAANMASRHIGCTSCFTQIVQRPCHHCIDAGRNSACRSTAVRQNWRHTDRVALQHFEGVRSAPSTPNNPPSESDAGARTRETRGDAVEAPSPSLAIHEVQAFVVHREGRTDAHACGRSCTSPPHRPSFAVHNAIDNACSLHLARDHAA